MAALALLAAAPAPAQVGAVQEHPQHSALSPQHVAPAPAQAGALQARVGVSLLSVNRLDTSLGSYALDFYLSFRCDQPCNPSEFEFINGHVAASVPEEDTPAYKAFRVQAELAEDLDLHAYPFDRHILVLALEDRVQTRGALAYVVDRQHTAVDPNLILPGWTQPGAIPRASALTCAYPQSSTTAARGCHA